MAHVKTAVSLPGALFKKVDSLARQLKVSRSRVVALALEDFTRRQRNLRLLEKVNAAYAESKSSEDEILLEKMRRYRLRLTKGD